VQASLGTKSGSESQGHARRALRNEHNFILIEILEFIPHGFHSRYQHMTVLNIRLTLLKVQVWPKELQGRTGRKCSSFIHDMVERHSSTK
jgi:hypothetical protein